MNLSLFIALRLGSKVTKDNKGSSRKSPSKLSNRIAIISVAVSIAIIIISLGVLGGFKREINRNLSGFSGEITLSAPGVEVTNSHFYINGDLSYISKIDSLDYVKSVNPVSYRTALLKTNDEIQGVLFKGVDSLYNLSFFKENLISGELPKYGNSYSNDILISNRLSSLLGYKVGDKVTSYFIDDDIKVRVFNVKGIYDAQLEELDKVLLIADIKHINRLNGWRDGKISAFEVDLEEGYNNLSALNIIDKQISTIMIDNSKDSDESVTLTTLRDNYYILYDWLTLLDINVLVILILMVAVAGVNMVSGILIILFENSAKIGLLKSLGMSSIDVSKVFLVKGGIIIGKGMLVGNVLAVLFCFVQDKFKLISLDPTNYFVSYVPIDISLLTLLLLNVISFVVIMVILIIPCNFISNVNPAKTLTIS